MAYKLNLFALILLFLSSTGLVKAENKPEKFVVGLILPLTGELADYGEALRNGFELAEEEMPEKFKYLELRYQDSQYNQKTALNAFNNLEWQGDVNLYHTWGVSPNETILPLANRLGRPVVAETSMRSAAKDKPYVIRVARTGYDAAEKLIQGFEKKKWKNIGIVTTQIPYYLDIIEALKVFASKHGITIEILAEVTPSEQDFKSIINRSKTMKFDAFGPLLLHSQILSYCKQAKATKFLKPIFGAHIHYSNDLMNSCLPLSDGALFPGQLVNKDFHRRYLTKFNTDLRLDSAAHSYETAKIIAELFGNKDSSQYSAQEILERFKAIKRETSSVGQFQYSETPEGGKSIAFDEILFTYKNKEILPY